jgi:hypothetical protein
LRKVATGCIPVWHSDPDSSPWLEDEEGHRGKKRDLGWSEVLQNVLGKECCDAATCLRVQKRKQSERKQERDRNRAEERERIWERGGEREREGEGERERGRGRERECVCEREELQSTDMKSTES